MVAILNRTIENRLRKLFSQLNMAGASDAQIDIVLAKLVKERGVIVYHP